MTTIHADEVQVGDVVEHQGRPHRVVHIDWRRGWAWPVASDGDGWGMALGHQLIQVERLARAA